MKTLRLSFLVLLMSSSAQATTLRGTVMDSMGAAIPNAHIIIHWDSVGLEGVTENVGLKKDKSATSDATGHFSLDLPPGVYDVFVAAGGFYPRCEKISLKKNEIHLYEVTLTVSRMLSIRVD
jgi:Carboxypeptidase regulatory-like domain